MTRGRRALGVLLLALVGCGEAQREPEFVEGREYRDPSGAHFTVKRLPKVEGGYHRVDGDTIRYYPFSVYEVASEDDSSFLVKVFQAEAPPPVPPPAVNTATEEAPAPTSSRFELVETGRGLPRTGQWRQGFDVADVDGDGHLDFVHGPRRKSAGTPVILRGDGTGGFERWAETRYPRLPYDYGDVAVADFDGNGTMDLALAAHLRGLTVLAGDGRGGFTPYATGLVLKAEGPPGSDARISSRALAVLDWNADRRPDLVVLGDGPVRFEPTARGPHGAFGRGMHVLLNLETGWTPLPPAPGAADDPVFGDAIDVGDVDGDGTADVLTASRVMGFARILRRRTDAGWESVDVTAVRPASIVSAVALADFDADGRDEMAIGWLTADGGTWTAGIDLVRLHDGRFDRRVVAIERDRRPVTALTAGHLDADGALDLVALREDGALETFAGDGSGFVTRDATVPVPVGRRGCTGTHVEIADLDRDGTGEIIASFAGEAAGFSQALERACPSGGAVEAWRLRRP